VLLLRRVGTRSRGTRSTIAHRSAAVIARCVTQRLSVLVGGRERVEAAAAAASLDRMASLYLQKWNLIHKISA
jgi:hypothetical protein